MSEFSEAFSAALSAEQISQVEFAALCGIDQSHVSRWRTGKLPPSRAAMRQIVAVFAEQKGAPAVAIEVLLGHLRDEALASGIHPNRLLLAASDGVLAADTVKVLPTLRETFAVLSDAAIYPETEQLLRSLAEMCEQHVAARADSATLGKIVRGEFAPAAAVAEASALYEVTAAPKKTVSTKTGDTRPAPPLPGATG